MRLTRSNEWRKTRQTFEAFVEIEQFIADILFPDPYFYS